MSSPNSCRSVLETVAKRYPVLEALEDDPHHKRDLVEELECSRSTIDRATRELESLALLERTNGAYQLTLSGELVLKEYHQSIGRLESIRSVSDVLEYVPRDAPMAACALEGAEIDYPEAHAPNEPLRRVSERVTDDVDRFRGVSGSERIPHFRDRLYEHTIDGSLDAEVVVTEEIATFLISNYPSLVHDVMVYGDFDFYAIGSVPYGLILLEGSTTSTMFLAIEAESGVIIIQNDSREAVEWANSIYRRYRAIATPLEAPESASGDQ